MREITTTMITTRDLWTWIGTGTGTTTTMMIITGIITSGMSAMKVVLRTPTVNTASVSVDMDISRSGEGVKVIGEPKLRNVSNLDQITLIRSRHAALRGTARVWT